MAKVKTYGKRKTTRGIVMHHTVGSLSASLSRFRNTGLGANAIIDRDGTIHELAPRDAIVGHTRPSGRYRGSKYSPRVAGIRNSNSYGIEIVAKENSDVTAAQIAAASKFVRELSADFGLDPASQVYGHGEVTPGNKQLSEGMAVVQFLRTGTPNLMNEKQFTSLVGGPSGWLSGGWTTSATGATKTPPASVSPMGSRVLSQGKRGDDVRALQTELIAAGFDVGRYGADGVYGTDTKAAVEAYQKAYNIAREKAGLAPIAVDGVVGTDTREPLVRAKAARIVAANPAMGARAASELQAEPTNIFQRYQAGLNPLANPAAAVASGPLGGYFTQIAGQRVGPPGLTGTVEAGADATATVDGKPQKVAATPIPRSRPNPLQQTMERIITKKGLLKKGAQGEAVKEIQKLLNARGVTDFRGRPLEIDGKLGPRTRQAIQIYQSLHPHLQFDGIVGPRTLQQMLLDTEAVLSGQAGVGAVADATATLDVSPAAQIAADMGTQLATGFQSPQAVYGNLVREQNTALVTHAARQPGAIPGGRLSPEFVASSPAYRTGMEGSPELPSRRLAAEMEVANAFTPHTSTGTLGASRGLSFDTLDRDGESIYSAAGAFARQRVEDRERFGGITTNSRGKFFEFEADRDAAGILRSDGSAFKGTGSMPTNIAQGGGFSSRARAISAGAPKGSGFSSRASDALTRAQERGGGGSGSGRSPASTVRSGAAKQSASSGRSPAGRISSAAPKTSTVRRTGSFGHTRSGRPIGGV